MVGWGNLSWNGKNQVSTGCFFQTVRLGNLMGKIIIILDATSLIEWGLNVSLTPILHSLKLTVCPWKQAIPYTYTVWKSHLPSRVIFRGQRVRFWWSNSSSWFLSPIETQHGNRPATCIQIFCFNFIFYLIHFRINRLCNQWCCCIFLGYFGGNQSLRLCKKAQHTKIGARKQFETY